MSPLSLSIVQAPDDGRGGQFNASGPTVTVGRGANCDWVLPDPQRSLSRTHCRLELQGHSWQVRDLSANGTFVNGAAQPVGNECLHPLRDGDRLRLGDYEIAIRLAPASAAPQGLAAPPRFGAADHDGRFGTADPAGRFGAADPAPGFGAAPRGGGFAGVRLPGLDDAPAAPSNPFGLNEAYPPGLPSAAPASPFGAEPDHSPAFTDAFRLPPVAPAPPVAGAAGAMGAPGDAAAVPDDWYRSMLMPSAKHPSLVPAAPPSAHLAPPPPPAPPLQAMPPAEPSPFGPATQPPAAWTPDPPAAWPPAAPGHGFDPVPPTDGLRTRAHRPAAPSPAHLPPHAPPQMPPPAEGAWPPAAAPSPLSAPASAPSGVSPSVSPAAPGPHPVPGPAAQPLAAAHPDAAQAALAVLLQAAGLPADAVPRALQDPDKALRAAGALLQASVAGMRALLMARGLVKREFRIEQTVLRPNENNPLKFATSDEQALATLLDPRSPGAQALRQAVDDLTEHEVAVMSATQVAARSMLDKLSPAALEADDPGGGMLPGATEKRLWAAYKRRHAQLLTQLEDDFDSAFGIAFARAYEQAVGQGGRRRG